MRHAERFRFSATPYANLLTSTNDPLFWLHHSFVDLIWEQWRQAKQTRQQRENHYPADNLQCATEAHFGGTIMRPFTPLINKDGLSNSYTDNLYEYAPRPGCSAQQDCGSELLFCDRSNGAPRCASKVKIGASCGGYRMGENPCYRGECLNGICQRSSQPNPGPAPTTGRPDVPTTTRRTWPTRPPWNGGSPTHIEPGYGCGVHVEPGYGSGPHVEPGYRNPDSPVYVEPGLDPITYPPSNQNPYLAFQRGK
ncbi:unnamed protein product, partial [Mesorhabditis spiculigera]